MLTAHLGGLTQYAQWFTWRLEWNAAKQKFEKTPCKPDGSIYVIDAQKPENWRTYDDAVATTTLLDHRARTEWATDGTLRYSLGFCLTKDTGYWFLDVDAGGAAMIPQFQAQFPGCFFEWSASGQGAHFIGRGLVPEHGCRNKALSLEFYTQERGICFGLTGQAWGSADTDHTGQIGGLAAMLFPPLADLKAAPGEFDNGPRADWDGYSDDEELLGRAMRSRSGESSFTGKAAFADLWNANVGVLAATYPPEGDEQQFGESEADQALAYHLAWWTGCDAERIERLMRRSKLYRAKWDEHRTYLRDMTINNACAAYRGRGVFQRRTLHEVAPISPTAPQVPTSAPAQPGLVTVQCDGSAPQVSALPAQPDKIDKPPTEYIDRIEKSDRETITNEIMPMIAADGALSVFAREDLVNALVRRLADFDMKFSKAMIRSLIKHDELEDERQAVEAGATPKWLEDFVYLTNRDRFYNVVTGVSLSHRGMYAKFARYMPGKDNGAKEDPAEWALTRWNIEVVADIMYMPCVTNRTVIVNQVSYANSYVPATVPGMANTMSPKTRAAIEKFYKHLQHVAGGRQNVMDALFGFLVHNVRYPGVKVRWAPLIKGIQGDGKSIIGQVLGATMGRANARPLNSQAIRSAFNDWASGTCVNVVEELLLTGRNRNDAANDLKPLITEPYISINRKGLVGIEVPNVTNYIAFTNHANAIPLEKTDRRWMVVFTNWDSFETQARLYGFQSTQQLEEFFGEITESIVEAPSEWRSWLMSCEVPEGFRPNSHAPRTEEKGIMRTTGSSEVSQIIASVLEDGHHGIHPMVVSSGHMNKRIQSICIAEGIDVPNSHAVNSALEDAGFFRVPGQVKWEGYPQRLWTRGKHSNEQLREMLDSTKIKAPAAQMFAEAPKYVPQGASLLPVT